MKKHILSLTIAILVCMAIPMVVPKDFMWIVVVTMLGLWTFIHIKGLNEAITAQQTQIDDLKRELEEMKRKE